MGYRNAKDVLPPDLLQMLQQYAEGECLYIPCRRHPYHQKHARALEERNQLIRQAYADGSSVQALAERFFLSPQAIYKILSKFK